MSRLVVLLVCVCLVLQLSVSLCAKAGGGKFTDNDYETRFTDWQHKHSKAYQATEFIKKFLAFKNNMDFVEDFNARNASFQVGLNDYADLDISEFRDLLIRPFAPRARDDTEPEFTGEGEHFDRAVDVDWSLSGAVTPVKNQGSCGSCWTFGTAGAIESLWYQQTGQLVSLSEQQLVDCDTVSNKGCNGGNPGQAMNYVKTNGGIATTASYPYEGVQKTCRWSTATLGATITGNTKVAATEAALQAAVAKQPVVVAIDAGLQSFQLYKSGIYNDAACSNSVLNHAVLAVGYGSDASGAEYWIIKNSWGTSWGLKGYLNLQRNAPNRCGIQNQGVFPTRTVTSGTTSTTSTATKAPTTTTTTTTTGAAKVTTTTTTGAKVTTTGSSSTTGGGAVAAYVYQDALTSGWTTSVTGTVTGLKTNATPALAGSYSISASFGAGGLLNFNKATAQSLAGLTKFSVTVKSSAATTLQITIGSYTATSALTTTQTTVSGPLSSFGSPASVTKVVLGNKGTATVTLTFDNIVFS